MRWHSEQRSVINKKGKIHLSLITDALYLSMKNLNFIFLMDRVSTLLKKLQKQLDEKSSATQMLQTVQILQAELTQQIGKKPAPATEKVC